MTVFSSPAPQPWTRWLPDKLRLALHSACDEADLWAAAWLLNQLCKHTLSSSVLPTDLDRRKSKNLSGVTSLATGELVFYVFGAIAHFARRLIAERTRDGIAAVQGKRCRRKLPDRDKAARQVGLGEATLCCEMAHVSVVQPT